MKISILGGGISGLSAAFYLSKLRQASAVSLYEAGSTFGGWIKSDKRDGYIFEAGPRTIRPKGIAGNATLELIELLDLKKKVQPIRSNHPAAKNRMIYAKGELCPLPSDIEGAIKVIPPFTKPLYHAGVKDFFGRKSKKPMIDESIYDFTNRRFGKEVADYLISAMICGICAGDAKEISVKFLMKNIFETEQKFGSVTRGMLTDYLLNGKNRLRPKEFKPSHLFEKAKSEAWAIYTLEGGLQTLPDTIVEKLSEPGTVSLNSNAKCERIKFEVGGPVQLTVNGSNFTTDHLISSVPSHRLGQMVKHQHPKLSEELQMIKSVDVAVINLYYEHDLLEWEGFGLLVPPMEKLPILGIIFDSSCFNLTGKTVLTVMCGGKWFNELFGKNPSEQQLLDVALENVKKILGIDEKPDHAKVNILRECIPQYVVGHHDRVERIRKYIEENKLPLSLCGASYDGVGVNDVILSAQHAVSQAIGLE